MNLIRLILKRPASVFLIMASVIIFGISSLTSMPLESMPDVSLPMQLVTIQWPGADADSIERLVTEPVEKKCETLTDINTISSTTYDNYTMVQLSYNYSVVLDDAYMELKEMIDNMMSELPENCGEPTIMEISMSSQATMTVSVSARGDGIQQFLKDDVVPALEGLNGVARVELSGAQDEYVRVVLNETKLKQYQLSIAAVAAAIQAADFDMPLGDVKVGSQEVALSAYGNIDVSSQLMRNIPIETPSGQIVHLSDVTSYLNLVWDEADSLSRYNGEESYLLEITKKSSASTINVCREAEKLLRQYSAENGLDYWIVSSEADNIMDTMTEVLTTLIIGISLTMFVLLLFFGDIRASIIVGFSMPLSILLAMVILGAAGFTFNMMSGTALIIAIGMIVDNSIVVIENCMRMKSEGKSSEEAAVKGAGSMLIPIFASTLTTIVVYIPLAMAEGMAGQMAGSLSWTIALVMLSSFICAATIVPLLFHLIKPVEKKKLPINRFLDAFKSFYVKVMPALLRHPGRVMLAAVGILAASVLLALQLNFVLFNSSYNGSITLTADFRAGISLSSINEMLLPLEETLLADENFSDVTLTVSGNTASFNAYAKEGAVRSSQKAVEEYTEQFGRFPGMDITVLPMGSADMGGMFSASETVDVTIAGDDLAGLEKGADLVEEAMVQVPGVIHISNPFHGSRTQGRLLIDAQKALNAGLSQASIAMQVSYLLNGMTADTVDYGNDTYDIVLEYPEGRYDSLTAIMDHPFDTASGRQVTLGELAEIKYETSLPSITRQDGQFITTLSASTTENARFSASSRISSAVKHLTFPEGVGKAVSMMEKMSTDEISNMSSTLFSAVFLVFLVMAVQFNSPRLSLMVMTCIPFSLAGSFVSIYASGRPMSLMGIMGFLMLFGIVVNNGIYLIDAITELRQEMPLKDALIQAGCLRLRPILMTTMTTVISMLPLIFGGNGGMEMMKEMAYIIVGGLVASTVLAVFLMPPFYLLMKRERLE